jgi:hypothetical protein
LSDSISEKQISGNLDEKSSKSNVKKIISSAPIESSTKRFTLKSAQNPSLTSSKSTIVGGKMSKVIKTDYKINPGAPQASSSFEKNPNGKIVNSIKKKPTSAPPKIIKEKSNLNKPSTNMLKPKNQTNAPTSNTVQKTSQFLTRTSTPRSFKAPNLVEQKMVNAFKKIANKYPEQQINTDFTKKAFLNQSPINQNKLISSNEILKDEGGLSHINDLNNAEIYDIRKAFGRIQKDFDLIKEQIKTLQIQQENLFQQVSEINNKLKEK